MVEVVVLDEDEKVGKKMDKEVSGRLGETWVAVVVVGGQHRTLYNIFFLSNRCLYFSLNYVLNNNTETFLLGTGANQVYSTLCYAKRAPQFREKYYWVTTLCIVET